MYPYFYCYNVINKAMDKEYLTSFDYYLNLKNILDYGQIKNHSLLSEIDCII